MGAMFHSYQPVTRHLVERSVSHFPSEYRALVNKIIHTDRRNFCSLRRHYIRTQKISTILYYSKSPRSCVTNCIAVFLFRKGASQQYQLDPNWSEVEWNLSERGRMRQEKSCSLVRLFVLCALHVLPKVSQFMYRALIPFFNPHNAAAGP